MSDEGEESDSGERARLSESPSPALSARHPAGSPSSPRPLDLRSSTELLLGDTDPPYLAPPDCLDPSLETGELVDSPTFTLPKFAQRTADRGPAYRRRQDPRADAGRDRTDEPLPEWRGDAAERFQHHGQRLHRAPDLPDHRHDCSPEYVDPEFNSQTRHQQT